jgi:chromosome segregation ATPase
MSRIPLALLGVFTSMLAGCLTPAQCAPTRTGVITTPICALSGAFRGRTGDLEGQLDAARAEHESLRSDADTAQRQVEAGKVREGVLTGQVRDVEGELDQIGVGLEDLERQLEVGRTSKAALERHIDDLKRRLAAIDGRAASPSSTHGRLDQTRRKLIELQRRLDSL